MQKLKMRNGEEYPLNLLYQDEQAELIFRTENPKVAEVKVDSQGEKVIYAKASGKTYLSVTCTDGACYDMVEIVVKERFAVVPLIPWLIIGALAVTLVFQLTSKPKLPERSQPLPGNGKEKTHLSVPKPGKPGEGRVGLAVPSAVRIDSTGTAVVPIRNSGNVPEIPVIKYQGKEVWRSPRSLWPGESISAEVDFGPGCAGEKFEVLVEPGTGGGDLGMALVVKIV